MVAELDYSGWGWNARGKVNVLKKMWFEYTSLDRGNKNAQEVLDREPLLPKYQVHEKKLGEVFVAEWNSTTIIGALVQLAVSMNKLMEMEEKMTDDSHCIGSKRSHSRGEEYAKENGIWKQMKHEEYDREKVEIRIHIILSMQLLQRSKEYQRCGCILRKKVKWHRLQVKREHRLNAQGKKGLLIATKYQ